MREWISAKDKLPEESDVFLCAFTERGKAHVERFYFAKTSGWLMPIAWQSEGIIDGITHWMPLPEPPKEDVE